MDEQGAVPRSELESVGRTVCCMMVVGVQIGTALRGDANRELETVSGTVMDDTG